MVASEAVPFAKTGGLADVAGALPLALGRLGHVVTVVMPRYHGIAAGEWKGQLSFGLGSERVYVDVFAIRREGVTYQFIDCPPLYDREGLYGIGNDDFPDNALRFAVLARAALGLVAGGLEPRPDVIHAHDWQAGLVPVYLRRSTDLGVADVPSVLTIHNLSYQGLFPLEWTPRLDLDSLMVAPMGPLEYWGRLSFLKGGLLFSDVLTTVSRRYAEEILQPELGFGFDGILRSRADDLVGILNGIDVDVWNPATDPYLPARYSASQLDGKLTCKRALLRTFGVSEDVERPLIGLISRLVDQKGFDILAEVADELASLPCAIVLLGSGEARYEALWQRLAARHPDRIGVRIGFDEALAHLIEAGSDMFLMPSRFEPCGLNQMYSLRYGTVPIVRATGGLDDTVRDYDERTGTGNGFKFAGTEGRDLLDAVGRALALFEQKDVWQALQLSGMQEDHSWDASAAEYVKVYRRVVTRALRAPQSARNARGSITP